MRILMVHNHYQILGGESVSFLAEKAMLEKRGHQVLVYERTNDEIDTYSLLQKASLPVRSIWARDSYQAISTILENEKPELVHFQNTFPLISPAAYYACRKFNVPVVQTLRNYRLLCPSALFLRDGQVCELGLDQAIPLSGVRYACYRDSHVQSSVVAAMIAFHRWMNTWQKQVTLYIALTHFAREKYIEGGLPSAKIHVKPNFLEYEPSEEAGTSAQDYVVYVGRLSTEKGIEFLIDAWKKLPDIPLKVIGEGPLAEDLRQALPNVICTGKLSYPDTLKQIENARFMIFPSIVYETFGRTIVEAFACGVPVVASRMGTRTEIIKEGEDGLLYAPTDAEDMANKIKWLWDRPEIARQMGQNARRSYATNFTEDVNYGILMNLYQRALETNGANA